MKKIASLLATFVLLCQIAIAETPAEIEGVWIVDIPQTLEKMRTDGTFDATGIAYMKDRVLPAYKRVIQSGTMANHAASGIYTADISLISQQGETFIMQLSGEINGKQNLVTLSFITQPNGKFIMSTGNEADGSAFIIWMRE